MTGSNFDFTGGMLLSLDLGGKHIYLLLLEDSSFANETSPSGSISVVQCMIPFESPRILAISVVTQECSKGSIWATTADQVHHRGVR